MSIMINVDKIFIINLDSRPDRLKNITDDLQKHSIVNYERFSAIRPTADMLNTTYKRYLNKHAELPYRIGALGCMLNHIGIIKIAKEMNYKKILILEDDCEIINDNIINIINDSLCQLEEINNKFMMLYLSGNHKRKYEQKSKNVAKINRTYTTHSYIVTENAYDIILHDLNECRSEIDYYYARIFHPKYDCYCTIPSLTTQKKGYSDIFNRNVDYSNCIK